MICAFTCLRASIKEEARKLCLISANQLRVQKLEQLKAHRVDPEPQASQVQLLRQKNHTARVQLTLAK
jgi:DNA repair ATPase RecN